MIHASIFEFEMKFNSKRKRSRSVYVMIEGQNVEIAVEWAKCFLCQKDMAETLLSSEKLHAIFKNLAGLQQLFKFHLLWIKSIKKEDLESTIKNYHPKHIIVAQQTMAPICLHKRKANAEKFRRMIKRMTH